MPVKNEIYECHQKYDDMQKNKTQLEVAQTRIFQQLVLVPKVQKILRMRSSWRVAIARLAGRLRGLLQVGHVLFTQFETEQIDVFGDVFWVGGFRNDTGDEGACCQCDDVIG